MADYQNKFNRQWTNTGTEPSSTLQDNGFQGGQKPPAGYFNWFWHKVIAAITEIQTRTKDLSNIKDGSATNSLRTTGSAEEVSGTYTIGQHAFAEGRLTKASGTASHAEGSNTTASGRYSHAEGQSTQATNYNAHSEGNETIASGSQAHAEGSGTTASGNYSHAEGNSTVAAGEASHAEGYMQDKFMLLYSKPYDWDTNYRYYFKIENDQYVRLETAETFALNTYYKGFGAYGRYSHSGGHSNSAMGDASYAMGTLNQVNGGNSAAYGSGNLVSGIHSFATGMFNKASNMQFVTGKYCNPKQGPQTSDSQSADDTIFIVGNGQSDAYPSNALRITADGQCRGTKSWVNSGADYARMYEWKDGNPNNEDRRGLFVILDGDKIKIATSNDDLEDCEGIVSANPAFIENSPDDWHDRYIKDIFGAPMQEEITVPERTDEITGEVIPEHTAIVYVENPEYNPEREYTPRDMRKEWACVGFTGFIVAVDDGTCEVNGYCKVGNDGKATKSTDRTNCRVMKRKDNTHILVRIK